MNEQEAQVTLRQIVRLEIDNKHLPRTTQSHIQVLEDLLKMWEHGEVVPGVAEEDFGQAARTLLIKLKDTLE